MGCTSWNGVGDDGSDSAMGQKNLRGEAMKVDRIMMREKILLDRLKELNPKAILFVGLGRALIGVGSQYTKNTVAIYSAKQIVNTLISKGGNKG